MDARSSISSTLDKSYTARRNQDVEGIAALFTADGRFAANGTPAVETHVERVSVLKGLFDAFEVVQFHEHCRVIDPPRAVVHWRGTFRARNGKLGETDVLDIFEMREGKIASVTTFYDTAFAAALSAPD